MPETTVLKPGPLTVVDDRCHSARREAPFVEPHDVSFVCRGTLGYRCRGQGHELVLVGRVGDASVCAHDHHGGGDECLCFELAPELDARQGPRPTAWARSMLPPLAELMAAEVSSRVPRVSPQRARGAR